KLVSLRFYKQKVRPQMEYALTILNLTALKKKTQYNCLCAISKSSHITSSKVICHLCNLSNMKQSSHILKARFAVRS
ncbi:MAG: hypothetical protein EXX96DRAFT_490160, partial [Benjaminiella poitrasii]